MPRLLIAHLLHIRDNKCTAATTITDSRTSTASGSRQRKVVFGFRTDKSQTGPKEFLQGTQARYLQADGGSSYAPVLEELKLERIPCMAHIRRKTFEGRQDAPMAADLILASIQKLYRIENQAKAQHLSPQRGSGASPAGSPTHLYRLGALDERACQECSTQKPPGSRSQLREELLGGDGPLPGDPRGEH